LVQDLDKVVREIQQLGNHGEEASQKITKLEALRKQKEDDANKMNEEKAKLEGMMQSPDKLITEMADEYGLNHKRENDDDEDGSDDGNDGGDAAEPPAATPPAAAPEVIIIEEEENPVEMVPEHEASEELEIIASEAKPEPPQPWLYTVLIRDYEESPSDDLDDLDDPTEADYNMNEWFPEDGCNDRDWVIRSRS
jgi:hypothetical protein